jgi:polyhydroxybutyrate depolymerase
MEYRHHEAPMMIEMDIMVMRLPFHVFAVTAIMLAACTGDAGQPADEVTGVGGDPTGGAGMATVTSSGGAGGSSAGAPGTGGSSVVGPGGSSGAGDAAATGDGATGATSTTPSDGCGHAATQALGSFVRHTMTVATVEREYFGFLPKTYDPMRAYRTVFLFHGCGGKDNNVPIANVSKEEAIVIHGSSIGDCWDTGKTSNDITFFDEMVKAAETDYCVDKSRIFGAGYSSGSWMMNLLGCARGNVLRAQANVSGGLPGLPACTGQVAAIFIHDQDDTTNVIAGGMMARDRILKTNMCGMMTMPDTPSPCVRYQGCAPGFPVDWCQTSGKMHDRKDGLAAPAFWGFFSAL